MARIVEEINTWEYSHFFGKTKSALASTGRLSQERKTEYPETDCVQQVAA